jgi:alanine racemase
MSIFSDTMRCWVDVDLAALLDNARKVAAISGSRLLPMVKANGYGLGASEVVRALEAIDPWGYGVASLEEAAALRGGKVHRPLLLTTPLQTTAIDAYLKLALRPSIGDPAALEAWVARGPSPFHIEIDTGMSRGGFRWNDSAALERARLILRDAEGWEGIFTHFVSSESDAELTALQWQRFQETLTTFPRRPSLVHAANSAAALHGKAYAGDLVRPGIFLYGGAAGDLQPRPVAALRGRVVALRTIQAGDTVGYNATWKAERRSLIATVSVGYADGFPRSPGRTTEPQVPRQVELTGQRVPVVGRVTMDMCMVMVERAVQLGEVATIFGGLVSIDEQAALAGTISYELLTRLGPRVPRRYKGVA